MFIIDWIRSGKSWILSLDPEMQLGLCVLLILAVCVVNILLPAKSKPNQ